MLMTKKEGRIPKLMAYAGSRKYLTYASLVFSALSSIVSVIPFYYIWLMLEEVLNVMPDYDLAVNVAHNGWMALGFTLLFMLLYVAGLICSHMSAFRIASNIRKTTTKHAMDMPPGTFDMMGSGKVRRIIQDSSSATETFLAHELPDMAGSTVLPLAILVMLFIIVIITAMARAKAAMDASPRRQSNTNSITRIARGKTVDPAMSGSSWARNVSVAELESWPTNCRT